jgi:hypothetical protein
VSREGADVDRTYARDRLWVGISAVGTYVLAAACLLVTRGPDRWLAGVGGSPASDALVLAIVLGLAACAGLPYDVLGGYVLPRRHGRAHPTPARFASAWLRGAAVLLALATSSGVLLLAAGRAGGRPAALGVLVAVGLLLIALQEPLARWVGGLRRVPDSAPAGLGAGTIVLAGDDPGFSGGFSGPTARLVLPARWLRELEPRELELLVERRRRILRSGAWGRALLAALAWNALGFLLASLLPGAGVTTVAELVTTGLGFTLWTFWGLLVLPTPSRRATRAADARALDDEGDRLVLAGAVRTLDRLQDDEPERPPGVEGVFHPVPSVTNRLRSLGEPARGALDAWNLARTALWLSHAGLSLLPRAVHCNAGRPELWVYLPGDG